MDHGNKSQSESGKEVSEAQAVGSATPRPIKPNGFATAYLLIVDLLMVAFSGVAVVFIYDGNGEVHLDYLTLLYTAVLGTGPVFLWLIGLTFCKYTHMGKNFYKYYGLFITLIMLASAGLLVI